MMSKRYKNIALATVLGTASLVSKGQITSSTAYTTQMLSDTLTIDSLSMQAANIINEIRDDYMSITKKTTTHVEPDSNLQQTAQAHAEYCARIAAITHKDMEGKGALQRVQEQFPDVYIAVQENNATGPQTIQAVMDARKKSPGHKRNLTKPDMNAVGIGCVQVREKGHDSSSITTYRVLHIGQKK